MQKVLNKEVPTGETIFGDETHVYRKLSCNEEVEGPLEVFNLEVAESHSYIANGMAVHNCQYCGKKAPMKDLNYDHVIPRIQGGKTVWENIVTSCYPCNDRKAGRTPEQAKMKLLKQPVRPATLPMTQPLLNLKNVPDLWLPYLEAAQGMMGVG
jgi:5-methylcytosine-specific restriction endonuclease McrA